MTTNNVEAEDFKGLARQLAQHLKDYELVKAGYLREETWLKNGRELIARAERVFDLIPF